MRFIGDVHGKYKQYKKIIADCHESVQVGDFGVGFIDLETNQKMNNPPHYAMIKGNHRFIRGNHDNPSVCREHSQYIADGTVENGIMFIGGAFSIDKHLRHENYDWWSDEELSYEELYNLTCKYEEEKPRIMVTHDCPNIVANHIFTRGTKHEMQSRTRQAFQSMWEIYKPEIWIFGHWHISRDVTILGTRFICLAELEYIDL